MPPALPVICGLTRPIFEQGLDYVECDENILKTMGDGLVFVNAGEMLTDEQKEAVLDRRDKPCQKFSVRHRTKLVDDDLQPDVVRGV